MSIKSKIEELKRVVELHRLWLSYSLLGEDSITASEIRALRKYGKLPMDQSINLVKNSFMLGRLKMLLKKKEYKALNLDTVEDRLRNADLSSLEKFSIEYAIFTAGDGIKRLSEDIERGAFDALSESMKRTVTEASVRNIVRDETSLALLHKETADQLTVRLVERLKSGWSRDWNRVAVTELHRAKILGASQAIINKVDIFANSEGIDSQVSMVPNPGRCEDCSHHYLDSNGNPKIFTLRQLMSQGSNADVGTSHKRGGDGLHSGWKSTLSPLHPECSCQLVYVPAGMGWNEGKLVVLDQEEFSKGLRSIVDKVFKTQEKPGSVPGMAAPGNVPGPGRPSLGGKMAVEMNYVPVSQPKPAHSIGTSSTGRSWLVPKGLENKKAGELTPEEKKTVTSAKVQAAISYGATPKDQRIVVDHITHGEITTTKNLTESNDEHSGANPAFRLTIKDNGRCVAKPRVHRDTYLLKGKGVAAGLGSVPVGSEPRREHGAFNLSTSLGVDLVPPTSRRTVQDTHMSVQHWIENSQGVTSEAVRPNSNPNTSKLHNIIGQAPSNKRDYLDQRLREMGTLDIVMNNNDRHSDNIMYSNDLSEVHAIDHGFSHGNGMAGHRGDIHKMYHDAKVPMKIPKTLNDRMDSMSLGDFNRTYQLTGVEPWAAAQTFLRARYASSLQKEEGHLDYEKFRSTVHNIDGISFPSPMGHWKHRFKSSDVPKSVYEGVKSSGEAAEKEKKLLVSNYLNKSYKNALAEHKQSAFIGDLVKKGNITKAGAMEFMRRDKEGLLPHQLFESWAKNYIDTAKNDSNHKDHTAAKELANLGVFMGPGALRSPGNYRLSDKHKEYEANIKPGIPPRRIGSTKGLVDPASSNDSTFELSSQDLEEMTGDVTASK